MIKSIVYFTVCLHLFLIGAMAQTTPDIIEYQDGTVTWTNSNSALYYTVEWQSSLTNDSWTGSYRSLQDLQSTQSLIAVAVPQFFRVSGNTNPAVTKTLSSTSSVQEAGYYEETDLADIDADLMADNIKGGVTIFGITGTYESASSPSTNLTQAQVDALALWANTLIESGGVEYSPGLVVESEIVGNQGHSFNTNWYTVASFTPFSRGGVINTEFKIRVNSVFAAGTVDAQIRVNGAPTGTIHSTSAESNVIFSDSSIAVPLGGVLSLSVRHSANDVGSVASDFKILVGTPSSTMPFSTPVDANPAPSP